MLPFLVAEPPESAAARTLAGRLARAGMAQDFGQADADWLATLAAYVEVVNRGLRMATFLLSDEQARPGAQDLADERAYAALAAGMAAFEAHCAIGRQMIAGLGALLDRLGALPVGDWAPWQAGATTYLRLRYGPALPSPRRPGLWPWTVPLRGQHLAGWGAALPVRRAYRLLSPAQQLAAVADWGPFVAPDGSDNPLWVSHWPQREEEALDRRAIAMCVEYRAQGTQGRKR